MSSYLIDKKVIVLIGMPGAGKSTIGVLLAKTLSRGFLDTDIWIQSQEGKRLQEILDERGPQDFCKMEEEYLCSIKPDPIVIATGGSAVYCQRGMNYLKTFGTIIFLDIPLHILKERLSDLGTRGVVMEKGQSFEKLYADRMPLYKKFADFTVDCSGLRHEEVVDTIVEHLGKRGML